MIPAVELLGQKAVPFLIFGGNSLLFSTVAAPVCIPTNSPLWFLFLHIFSNIGRKISDITCNNIFTDMSPTARDIKERINKYDVIKIKSFCTTKNKNQQNE